MNRKPGFPNSTCSIKLPDGNLSKEDINSVENSDDNSFKKRQQLISFGHKQWGFNNWSWAVTKQDLDFVDFSNGKYCAGVVAFVSINVKSLGIHREDVGYATCFGSQKGFAVHSARKCSVTNALRETFLSFGGDIATSLMEQLELAKADGQSDDICKVKLERKANDNRKDTKNEQATNLQRKDSSDSSTSSDSKNIKQENKSPLKQNTRQPMTDNIQSNIKVNGPTANHNYSKMVPPNGAALVPPHVPVGGIPPPPMGVRPPMPLHPSNVSYVVQRVMPPLYSVQCATTPPPYHNAYYTEYAPWPVSYDNTERHHANLNYNVPPKNFVVNTRSTNDCSRSCNSSFARNSVNENDSNNYNSHAFNMNGTWIKPTIFYDGFWTEQKVKKWVSEQNDKTSISEETSTANTILQNHSKI